VRLTVSPPSTPNAESSDDEARSRQGSTATSTSSIGSTGGGGLARKRTGGSVLEAVVSVHLTPLKDACGKVGKFVFVLATGI
jgi:hypothetical protein